MEQGDFVPETEQNGLGFLITIQLSSWQLVPAELSPSLHPPSQTEFQPSCLPSHLHINKGFGRERF